MYVLGLGPGCPEHRTLGVVRALAESQVVVGYKRYLESISDLTEGKELIASGMTQEVERCRQALRCAGSGQVVALVSSGDPGIYGMAGLALELAEAENLHIPVQILPGVTAASAAAAALGAPLMLDFAVISLSDLLISWDVIRRRLEAVAGADLVVALYNPRSRKRVRQLEEAAAIFRAVRPGQTPVGVVTAASQDEESVILTDLDHLLEQKVGMSSMVIIGNSTTRRIDHWLVTTRGYNTDRPTDPPL